jgi:hypothetical protein
MGFEGEPDQNRERADETPASRGGLKRANKMFADKSSQQIHSTTTVGSTSSLSE